MTTKIVVLLYNNFLNKYDTKTYETEEAAVDSLGILHIGPKDQELAWFNSDAWVGVDRIVEPDEPMIQEGQEPYEDEEFGDE